MVDILFLCSRVPYPLTGGAKVRLFNTASLLAEEYTVDLLIVDEGDVHDDHINALESVFNDVTIFTFPKYKFYLGTLPGLFSKRPLQTFYYQFDVVNRWLYKNVTEYDLLYCNHVRTTEYAMNYDIPKVVDLVDALSRNYAEAGRGASGIWRAIYPIESKRLRHYERLVVKRFDHSFIITEEDKSFVESDNSKFDSFSVVPNGVSEDLLSINLTESHYPSIVFLGKMDYMPNEDAASYFADEIFPLIRKKHPEVTYRIVGTNPTKRVQALGEHPRIEVTGFVDDPVKYLSSATVVVAPMRFGAGLQNKVLEAMALEKPVVTTKLGGEGIEATAGVHFEVATDANEFAKKVCLLIEDADQRRALGRNARRLIAERYTWDEVRPRLMNPIEEILS